MRYLPNFRSSSFDVRPPVYDCDFTKLKTLVDLENKGFSYGRAGLGTYVDEGGYIVYGHSNLLFPSETFNVTWTQNQGTVTYPVSGEVSPNNTFTVNRFNENTASGVAHGLSRAFSASSLRDVILTFSAYLKEDVNSNPRRYTGIMSLYTSQERMTAAFDVRNGVGVGLTASQSTNAKYTNYGITDVGNGWYRCWVQLQIPYYSSGSNVSSFLGTVNTGAGIAPTLSDGNLPTYTGGGVTAGIFCWGTQLEANAGPKQYIPTTTSAVYWPRFNNSKGLLLEVSTTNILNWSETFGTTTGGALHNWNYSGITTSIGTTSPNNITTAIRFKHDGSTTGAATISMSNPAGSTAQRAFSIWTKRITGTGNIWYSTNNGISQAPFIGITNNWYRHEFASNNINHQLVLGIDSANDEIEFWGAQLEAYGWPTNYIPTANVGVARSGDACSLLSPNSNFINSDFGSLMAEYGVNAAAFGGGTISTTVRLGKGNCAAYYALGEFTTTGSAAVGAHRTISNFIVVSQSNLTSTWTSGQFRKAAFNYIAGTSLSGFISGLSGSAPTPNASITGMNKIDLCPTRPTSLPVEVGRSGVAQSTWIKRLKYWNVYLNIEDLRKITGST